MTIKMWDLAAAEDDRRFSPYCWRAKMALAHKGLKAETIPWRFTEKEAIAVDLFNALHEKDQPYFRESREKRLGKTLEQFGAEPKQALTGLRTALLPVRKHLVQEPYVCGKTPAFADYILFGAFQWARAVSPLRLLEPDDPVYAWRERMLDLYDGLARKAKGYPVWA